MLDGLIVQTSTNTQPTDGPFPPITMLGGTTTTRGPLQRHPIENEKKSADGHRTNVDVQRSGHQAEMRRVVAGVLTGVTERLVSHPIETCKVVLQDTPASTSALHVLSARWRDKGPASFFRGIVPSTLGRGFQTSLRFYILEAVTASTGQSVASKFLGGIAAGMIDTFLMAPIESTKTRSQAKSTSWVTTFVNTWKNEGIAGYYRGSTATLCRQTGNLCLRFGIFFNLEGMLTRSFAKEETQPAWIPLAAGALAGAVAAYFTTPMDLIKTQMQSSPVAGVQKKPKIVDVVRSIHAQEESLWRKWFRGGWTRVIQQTPTVAVQFFLYRAYERMLVRLYPDHH